ncbi:MAG: hypothetical protein WC465_03370 [Patescibacteria group bacterium]
MKRKNAASKSPRIIEADDFVSPLASCVASRLKREAGDWVHEILILPAENIGRHGSAHLCFTASADRAYVCAYQPLYGQYQAMVINPRFGVTASIFLPKCSRIIICPEENYKK